VDDATDEVHQQPQEAVVDDVVLNADGFSGGPHDTLVMIDYAHHVTVTIWNEEIFIFLNK